MPDRNVYEQAALDYCAPRGIRLSEFLEVWSDGDQWAALEWQVEQASKCTGCGLDTRQTVGPEHVDKWNAELIGHCDGCRAKARIEAGDDRHPDPDAGGRLRFWRDEERTNGRVDDTGGTVPQAEPAVHGDP